MAGVFIPDSNTNNFPALEGKKLYIVAFLLSISNFIVILDMTIANVSITHIAGSLAISLSEGTYVITSYAVAEAISVPLTGWLSKRFGTLRVYTTCIMLFGLFSFICGSSQTLSMLIVGRICQGLVGGPLMPLTQTLLMNIFKEEKRQTAIGLSSMTTLIAPVMGPIVGGYICDNYHWGFIFFINIPIAIFCSIIVFKSLKGFESSIIKEKIDYVGLLFLVIWVGALQLMLDKGKDLDWFESPFINFLLGVSIIGFFCFIIWEVTEKTPIVDLRIFRHKGYTIAVLTLSLTFGAYFGSIVLTPLWLQNTMGYTATWSGYTTAATGVLAIVSAPIAAMLSRTKDSRMLISLGIFWLALLTLYRSFASTDLTQSDISIPLLIQGIGMPFFFVPLTALALTCVEKDEIANAAGLMNFLRTFSGAIATSVITTSWDNDATVLRTDLVTRAVSPETFATMMGLENSLESSTMAMYLLDNTIQLQALTLSTNKIFLNASFLLFLTSILVWFIPKKLK
ncbi:MAG: Multidrug export protein EmrB [Holosporales bacterium]